MQFNAFSLMMKYSALHKRLNVIKTQGSTEQSRKSGLFAGMSTSILTLLCAQLPSLQTTWAQPISTPHLLQLPLVSSVSQGNVGISQTLSASKAQLTVSQNSANAIINWSSFNVGQNATVNFIQPDKSSTILNRVLDSNPSQIFGHINANGQIFLSNPNGIYFSPTASADVGALTATTHSISDENWSNNRLIFQRHGSTAQVTNEGSITTSLEGYVALLAPEVRNNGVIVAQMGTVALASGESITLNFSGNKSLAGITTTPSAINTLIKNSQAIRAPDGQIILSAMGLSQLSAGVINNSGSLEANSLTSKGGRIVLESDQITLNTTSTIQANGALGGGSVFIGGDWLGNGPIRAATSLTMETGSTINASAMDTGPGGTVVLRTSLKDTDGYTSVQGSINAQGGPNGGDGGQVETSGSKLLLQNAQVNTSAKNGTTGQWLLDPSDVIIDNTADDVYSVANLILSPGSGASTTHINAATLTGLLALSNITISTTNNLTQGTGAGNITLASSLALPVNRTLTLSAANQVISSSAFTTNLATGSTLVFNAGADSSWAGALTGTGNVTVNMPAHILTFTTDQLFTGSTTLTAGTLSLSGNSLTLSSGLINNANFSIDHLASTATIKSLSGNGGVALGSKTLTISNASGSFGGVISGAGNVNISSGSQTLTGINIYTGSTQIASGATLILSGSGALSADSSIANAGTLSLTNKSNINTLELQRLLTSSNVMVSAPSNLDVTISNAPSAAATTFTGSGNLTIGDLLQYSNHLLNLSATNTIYINQPIAANYSLANNAVVNPLNTAQLMLSGNYVVNAPVYIGNPGTNFFTKVNSTTTPWVVLTDLGVRADATTAPSSMTLQGLSGNFKISNPTQLYFVLGVNIDAAPSNNWSGDAFTFITGFVPIGYYKSSGNVFFTQPSAIHLDGLGHSVSNLSIVTTANLTPSSLEHLGFISSLGDPGFVRNFSLVNENIQFNGPTIASLKFNIGGVIGTSQNGTSISKVSVSGNIKAAYAYDIGGIAGSSASTVSNAFSSALITLQSTTTSLTGTSVASAGGLMGRTVVITGVSGTLNNDFSSGNVIAPASAYAGSLIGDIATSSGTVTSSYASGQISTNSGLSFSTPGSLVGAPIGSGTLTQSAQLSSAASKVQANFVGWNFVDTISMGTNGPMNNFSMPLLMVEPSAVNVVFGGAFPAVTYSLLGLVGPDTLASVTFTPSALQSNYTSGQSVGIYPFTATGSLSGQTNAYKLVFDSANLTVNKATLYVNANSNQSAIYGASPTVLYGFNTAANGSGTNVLSTDPSLLGLSGSATFNNAVGSSSNAGNYSLSYLSGLSSKNYNFNSSTSPITFSVTQAPITLSGSKTYDGNAVFTSGTLTATGVNSETLSLVSGSATANSKNVGGASSWSSLNALVLGNGTGLASNYTLSGFTSNGIVINRLSSVTWTGGASGNWFDPANWSGSAVPDLSNVADVVIPANKLVNFGSTLISPAQAGTVVINSLSGAGQLSQSAGTLNIGSGGYQLSQFSQTAGDLSVVGNFGVTQNFSQSSTGTLTVGGTTSISSGAGVLTLGNLNATGALSVTTSAGGIVQSANTALIVSSSASFTSVSGGAPAPLDLSSTQNHFQGLTQLNASSATLTNSQALSLGSVTTLNNLTVRSAGALSLGATHVGADLSLNSAGGDITQNSALSVHGNANINAGTGNITLTQSGNSFGGTVSTVGSTVNIVGLPSPPPAPYTPPPDPALTDAQIRALTPTLWSNVSIRQLVLMTPAQFTLLPVAVIPAMTAFQLNFLNSGQIKALTPDQVGALTPLQMTNIGSYQVSLFTDAQFSYFKPSTFAAFSSTILEGLSSNEIKQITGASFSQLSAQQLSLFNTIQLQAMTPVQLANLSNNQTSAWTLQQWGALSDIQLNGLQAQVLAHLSPAVWAQWTPNTIKSLQPEVFTYLTAAQLNAMSVFQLQSLSPLQISKLSPLEFPLIQDLQLSALSPYQMSMLNALQVSRLTSSQIKALSYAQFSTITTPTIKRYLTGPFSSLDILNYFLAHPSLTDAQVVSAMDQFAVSPQQISDALATPLSTVQSRYESQGGVVFQTLKVPFSPLSSDFWGSGATFTSSDIKSNALSLLNNGKSYDDLSALMFQFNVSPAQFRDAFVAPGFSQ